MSPILMPSAVLYGANRATVPVPPPTGGGGLIEYDV